MSQSKPSGRLAKRLLSEKNYKVVYRERGEFHTAEEGLTLGEASKLAERLEREGCRFVQVKFVKGGE